MKQFKNSQITKYSVITVIIAFVVCAVSITTVHALSAGKKVSGHAHSSTKTTNNTPTQLHVSEHHLLTQPNAIDTFNVALPVDSTGLLTVSKLSDVNLDKIEVVNNQGAPPLLAPLKTGIVNPKIW